MLKAIPLEPSDCIFDLVSREISAAMLIEEYKTLRAEILSRLGEANTIVLAGTGGIGAAYLALSAASFNAHHVSFKSQSGFLDTCFLMILWTPFFFSALTALKSHEVWGRIVLLATYVRQIESLIYPDSWPIAGWEHFIDCERQKWEARSMFRQLFSSYGKGFATPPYAITYFLMMASTFIIASVLTVHIVIVTRFHSGANSFISL
jgi:hypothetical protein